MNKSKLLNDSQYKLNAPLKQPKITTDRRTSGGRTSKDGELLSTNTKSIRKLQTGN